MTRSRTAFFAAAFAAALLPRLVPILHGAVFADDLVHKPDGHLMSYRFLDYLELLLWQGVFGARYLMTAAPKLMACLYTAGLCSVLRHALQQWGAPERTAFILPLLIPLHPIWNTFVIWNVTAVYVLSLLLVAFGYWWSETRPAIAALIIALGISGYQVHAGLIPVLIGAEYLLRKQVAVRRIVASVCGAVIYLIAAKVAALAGMETWGNRGMTASVQWRSGLHAMSDNLATVTQPLLSYFLGVHASIKLWYALFFVLALLVLIVRRSLIEAAAPIVFPLAAAAVIVPLNVRPTGPRVAGAIWIAVLLSLIPLLNALGKWSLAVAIAAAAVMVPPSLTDAANRAMAWEADRTLLNDVTRHWGARRDVVIAIEPDARPSTFPRGRPIVLQNFNAVTPWHYSNLQCCAEWLFSSAGFKQVVKTSSEVAVVPGGESPNASWGYRPAESRTVIVLHAKGAP